MHKIIYFPRKPEKILGFSSKFRLGRVTLNTDFFWPNLESKMLHSLCNLTAMGKTRSSPYHPMFNGMVESVRIFEHTAAKATRELKLILLGIPYDSAFVKTLILLSSLGGFLTNSTYHHSERFKSINML